MQIVTHANKSSCSKGTRSGEAEAERFKVEALAEAEANKTRLTGQAQAEAILARGAAEAEANKDC